MKGARPLLRRHTIPAIVVVALLTSASLTPAAAGGSAPGRPDAPPGCIHLGKACVTVVGSLTTVRPTIQPLGATAASLTVARNEFQSFQVVVEAGSQKVTHLRVSLKKTPSGPGGSFPTSSVTIYREAYYEVVTPSDLEGDVGLWPDALIPTKDVFYGEKRHAFPIKVPAGQNRAAWIDVLVPPAQAPAAYNGSLRVTAAGGLSAVVPFHVQVLHFTMPSTATLDSAFGSDPYMCAAHFGPSGCASEEQKWQLYSLYIRAGLEDRISISPPYFESPASASVQQLFDRYVTPMFQGQSPQTPDGLWTPVRLPGAQLTSLLANSQFFIKGANGKCCVDNPNNPCDADCLAGYRHLAMTGGFVDRFLALTKDEPGDDPENWKVFAQSTDKTLSIFPELKDHGIFMPNPIQFADKYNGASSIDVISPLIQNMDDKPGSPFGNPKGFFVGNQRGKYTPFLQADPNNRVWMYQACQGYGCPGAVDSDPYYKGWAAFAIDEPASEQRAMPWLDFVYPASGIFYYSVDSTLFNSAGNTRPWEPGGQFYFGGNGDGNLFYPGIPDPAARGISGVPAIGGTHDIPIESIRLKRIRDGFQDYEYLNFLAHHGKGKLAHQIASGLFPTTYETAVSQADLNAARAKLTQAVAAITG